MYIIYMYALSMMQPIVIESIPQTALKTAAAVTHTTPFPQTQYLHIFPQTHMLQSPIAILQGLIAVTCSGSTELQDDIQNL